MTGLNVSRGFSLVELIAVLMLAAVLAASVVGRVFSNNTYALQSSRDQLVAAVASAQQLAMVQRDPIRLTTSGSSIDIRRDQNRDGNFSASESVRIDGQRFPVELGRNRTVSTATLDFNRLGRTSAASIIVGYSGATVSVSVSASGYAQ